MCTNTVKKTGAVGGKSVFVYRWLCGGGGVGPGAEGMESRLHKTPRWRGRRSATKSSLDEMRWDGMGWDGTGLGNGSMVPDSIP